MKLLRDLSGMAILEARALIILLRRIHFDNGDSGVIRQEFAFQLRFWIPWHATKTTERFKEVMMDDSKIMDLGFR